MDTINEHMTADHRLCDAIYERAGRAAEAGDFSVLAHESESFLRRIAAHIDVEDNILFPAFEERTGMRVGGPTAVMRAEHRMMEKLFEQMRAAVEARDAAGYRCAAAEMMQILVAHNQKEEMMLYPMLDEASGEEGEKLLDEVRRALPLDRE